MEPESESFEVNLQNEGPTSFFQGLRQAPRLSQKEKDLNSKIKESSSLQTKVTTLSQKIQTKKRAFIQDVADESAINTKVMVEGRNEKKVNVKPSKQKLFQNLDLIRPILKAINEVGYVEPTPVQQMTIPTIMAGKDIVASSITGSGKTAAFLIPILQRYYGVAPVGYIRALIVTPTRELAIQIYQETEKLNKYTRLEAALVIGGSQLSKQEMLLRNNPEIVIATPGRLIDLLLNSRSIGIENLEMIIFDEADKLLELGFEPMIKQIMSHTNNSIQSILFSATMGSNVKRLATITTRKAIRLSADPDNSTAQKLHQQIIKLAESEDEYRESVLLAVVQNLYKERVIIFFKTKKECHRVAIIMGLLGLKACQLHGNLSQTQRISAYMDFREGKFDFLLATDLASRGLDIKEVKTVINFELPAQLTRYIHRIGRTARAGSSGASLTLCSHQECLELKKMSRKTGDRLYRVDIKKNLINKNQGRIYSLEADIKNIIEQEREERAMRKAEMELEKLDNIADHQEEIYSRPKKQWFMSEKEKQVVRDEAKEEAGIKDSNKQRKSKPIQKKNGPRNGPRDGPRNKPRPRNKNGPKSNQKPNQKTNQKPKKNFKK